MAVAARIGLVSRREARVEGALPPVLDAVAGARRAGAATPQALGAGRLVARGPLRDDLDAVLDAVAAGVPLRDALSAWRVRTPAPGVKLVVAALSLAAEVGGSGAAPIEAVAASVRDRLAAQREARALATTARLSVGVMAAVPPLFAVLLASAEPGGLDFFVGTPLGIACLVLGVALDGAGAWWMRRIAGSVT